MGRLVGFVIVGAATVPFALATASTDEWILMSALVVRGFGLGAVTIPLMTAAFVGLDRPDVPHASIITRIAQQIGGSFGVALLAVILDGALAAGTGVARVLPSTRRSGGRSASPVWPVRSRSPCPAGPDR